MTFPRRYPGAIWKGAAGTNYSPTVINPSLVVVHVAQGDGSLSGWFHDPAAVVSAHLWNPKVGPMEQYVDLHEEAYAEMAWNNRAWSVEHEGYSGERLTHGQAQRIRLLAVFARQHAGIPFVWRPKPNTGPGWCSHGSLGVEGGDHPDCPGAGIVADVRAILAELRRAQWGLR